MSNKLFSIFNVKKKSVVEIFDNNVSVTEQTEAESASSQSVEILATASNSVSITCKNNCLDLGDLKTGPKQPILKVGCTSLVCIYHVNKFLEIIVFTCKIN